MGVERKDGKRLNLYITNLDLPRILFGWLKNY